MKKGLDLLLPRGNADLGSKAVKSIEIGARVRELLGKPQIKNGERGELLRILNDLENYDYSKFAMHEKPALKLREIEKCVEDIENTIRKSKFGFPISGGKRE